ncbi:MAG: beta-N-acetylhexosaminidase [Betaproteobacteria bacterium]|nr:beta-N-acetylhexosaminidase [Betaproteobacteria bacterium]
MNKINGLHLGPVMLDVTGTALTDEDRRRLLHPLTGGVILFTRNFQSPQQLAALTAEIHGLRSPALFIAVDHEGGRVQRFREGFTTIPAMREIGALWEKNANKARQIAQDVGYVLAGELRAHGVDLTFAPVLDVDFKRSSVIGDRAFHADPDIIANAAQALVRGLNLGGMSSVGKHFPGHGHVRADSHHEVPIDDRPYGDIERSDLVPFRRLIEAGLGAVMPAHVIYPQVDADPAGFSEKWLKQILRKQLEFDGVIFSDDLSMEGAKTGKGAGGVVARAKAALQAGCDMVLVCNDAGAANELLAGLEYKMPAVGQARLATMRGRGTVHDMAALQALPQYGQALASVKALSAREGDLFA